VGGADYVWECLSAVRGETAAGEQRWSSAGKSRRGSDSLSRRIIESQLPSKWPLLNDYHAAGIVTRRLKFCCMEARRARWEQVEHTGYRGGDVGRAVSEVSGVCVL